MKYLAVKKMMLRRLKEDLPSYLSYHNLEHVLDVMNAAEEIAKVEGINGVEMTLLKTAALFHDSGYVYGPQNHEERSCEIAQQILPEYNYSQERIDIIKGIIMATKIPQTPKNHLEEIMGDADLDYLGRDDFFEIGSGLFEELKHFGVVTSEEQWNKIQEKFIEAHSYHTATSIAQRNAKKKKHLEAVKKELKKGAKNVG